MMPPVTTPDSASSEFWLAVGVGEGIGVSEIVGVALGVGLINP
jgi:hypothetical protein